MTFMILLYFQFRITGIAQKEPLEETKYVLQIWNVRMWMVKIPADVKLDHYGKKNWENVYMNMVKKRTTEKCYINIHCANN